MEEDAQWIEEGTPLNAFDLRPGRSGSGLLKLADEAPPAKVSTIHSIVNWKNTSALIQDVSSVLNLVPDGSSYFFITGILVVSKFAHCDMVGSDSNGPLVLAVQSGMVVLDYLYLN